MAAMLLRTLHQRQAVSVITDTSAQLLCNLMCIFGKAREGKSTLMNVMSHTEVRGA